MTACLIVRAEVAQADREDFDRWYRDQHLPDAHAAFGSLCARRGWSDVTSGVHIAFYEFPDLTRARAILASDEMKAQVAEFDRVWGDQVNRTREVVEVVQTL